MKKIRILAAVFSNNKKCINMAKTVLHKDSADYMYQLLVGAVEREESVEAKLILLNQLYTFLLRQLTQKEQQFFSSNYERSVFVIDRYRFPSALAQQMRGFGFLMKKLRPSEDFDFAVEHVQQAAKALSGVTAFVSSVKVPKVLIDFHGELAEAILDPHYEEAKEETDILDAMVLEIGNVEIEKDEKCLYVLCATERFGRVQIRLGGSFIYLKNLLWKFARFNALALQKMAHTGKNEGLTLYRTAETSLVILDPDFLIDASVIAQCYFSVGTNPLIYLVKKFAVLTTNYYFMRGNMVNSYLDENLSKNPTSIPDLFEQYIRKKPIYALVFDNSDYRRLQNEVSQHIQTLNNDFVQKYKNHNLTLEPTFLSEIYGIRGRLDVLVEYDNEPNRNDVIELKTSKDPKQYQRMVWSKDRAQAICYNLLLNSINKDQMGSSAILYSSVAPKDNPIRNVPNDMTSKRSVMKVRNGIVYLEHLLSFQPEWALDKITAAIFEKNRLFTNEMQPILHFRKTLDSSFPIEKAYFYDFVRFVACEQRSAAIGSHNQRGDDGFAALWNHTLSEKRETYKIIDRLRFEEVTKKEERFLVSFLRDSEQKILSTIRRGDFILIYPQEDSGDLRPTKHQILKATIKAIDNERLIISPMNPNVTKRHFERFTNWVIEPEFSEVSFGLMHQSLFQFLEAKQYKKDLLLGLREPVFGEEPPKKKFNKMLKPTQKKLLSKALSAKDYFLLQGPPGTGKTSYMLRELVIQLLENPYEKIILLAYTNRAVDEICKAIKTIESEPFFFRLGYGSSTEHKDVLLSHFVHKKKLKEIKEKILNCRIFVSTVLTFQRSPELWQNIHFSTAIIDEASQLLEPQIVGVLCQVDKFILIGDEKQLPAVVVQSSNPIPPKSELLAKIGLTNLSNSLFERLLKRCQENRWKAFGRLKDQGRMHEQIQTFPNEHYYDGDLSPINPKVQCSETPKDWKKHKLPLLQKLYKNRTLFIPTQSEKNRNVNIGEAKKVAEIVQDLISVWGLGDLEKMIGIITPYRAQIAEIKKHFPNEIQERLTIDTVERFQGSQRRVIIISLALNNPRQLSLLEVLDDEGLVDRKLNVALTRAQDFLIILGCPDVLRQSVVYRALLEHYEGL